MPNWKTASEVWLQYAIEAMEQDIDCIVANDTHGNTTWNGRIKAVSLNPARTTLYNKILWQTGIKSTEKLLWQTIQRTSVTHILCHYGAVAVQYMNIWQKTAKPLFVHFHGFDATFDLRTVEDPNKDHFSSDYIKNLILLSKKASFIANSNFTKSLLMEAGLSDERIHVKHLGVPIPDYTKSHIDKDENHILQIGRLVDFKSPDRTIRAFEIAREKGLKARLTIVGDGSLRPMCELMRLRSPYRDSIHLLGAVSPQKVKELLCDADIYTQHNIKGELTHQAECFGVTIIEAMASGLPVVGTRSGAVVETVIDGETGILVDPGDVEKQADAFIFLSKNHEMRQKLGNAGKRRAAEYFSVDIEKKRLKAIMGI